MTDATWRQTLLLFEETQERLLKMKPMPPAPMAMFCRESGHRTLGHLTACQAAWIPLMRKIRDGADEASIPINPDPLFRKLRCATTPWEELLDRFVREREQWRLLLGEVDVTREVQTRKRVYTAQTVTKRMVDHEKRHLDENSTSDPISP